MIQADKDSFCLFCGHFASVFLTLVGLDVGNAKEILRLKSLGQVSALEHEHTWPCKFMYLDML